MSQYTKADILQWMLGAFEVEHRQGNELKFPCPTCGHEAFYFNIRKVLGYCHRAGCHTTLNLEQTINIVGFPPELAGYVPGMEKKERKAVEVTLPPRAAKIGPNDVAVSALAERGVTWDMIQKWDMHTNKTHIIVPIYEDGKLVQYNSRRVNTHATHSEWFSDIDPDALRYKYASGVAITNFILGWEECKLWEEITFVENTFVSMWLRDLGVTTNFGSYLSPRQVDMLVHSRVKRVTFLWDEGANSQKAERMLKKVGISARSIYITGQPDDHTKEEIKELLK
jgi:hypothetical protein